MLVPRYRGARDWLPADMARFRRIEDTFRALAAKYGYQEVRTPTLEYLHLFTAAGTLNPDQLARVYSFLDWDGWSGERVALRPDGTIPTARLFLENLQPGSSLHTVRLCYVENVFAFSNELGERERWQCGAELLGGDETAADAELLLLACQVLGRLEAGPVVVRLSHAGLLKAVLRVLDLPSETESDFLDHLIAGHTTEAVRLADGQSEAARLLPLLFGVEAEGPGFVRNLATLTAEPWPEVAGQLERFLPLAETLTALERPYRIHLALDRGFEYYTGALFHLYVGDVRVGGGGRYDDLLPLIGGAPLAASGFALYMNALLPLLQVPPEAGDLRLILADRGRALPHAFRLADALRAEGWAVTLQVDGIQADSHPRVSIEEEGGVVRYRLRDGAGRDSVVLDQDAVLQWLRTSPS